MVERQDIDALLIGALYGELTPSQESELTAHLASHPADKAALEGLTLTRDQVRSSRILAVQVEPPQSVSALLIQEAARRAPKAPSEGEGWFARFVRSFVQHPAMAAAAMLVLVVGIAAVVGRKNGNQFANEAADRTLSAPTSSAPIAAANDKSGLPTEGGAAGSSMPPEVAQTAAPAGAAGSGSVTGYADTGAARDEASGKDNINAVRAGDRVGMPVTLAEEHQGGKLATADGIVLDRRAQGPKDLADDKAPEKESLRNRVDQQKAKNQRGDNWGNDGDLAKGTGTAEQPVAIEAPGVGGGAAAAPPPPPPPPPSRQYASPPPRTPTTPTVSSTQGAPASTVTMTPTAAAPQNAPAKSTAHSVAPASPAPAPAEPPKPEPKKSPEPREAKPAEKAETKSLEQETPKADKSEVTKSDPTTDWAKSQHAALVAKARNGECTAAADLAVVIEGRAPSYFAANIANDRDLKACQATITAAREKEAEKRAAVERAKKAGSASEPKAAKKADAPKATTTTDSK
jgi:hypothetical protein